MTEEEAGIGTYLGWGFGIAGVVGTVLVVRELLKDEEEETLPTTPDEDNAPPEPEVESELEVQGRKNWRKTEGKFRIEFLI